LFAANAALKAPLYLATMIKPGGLLLTNEALPGSAPSKLADSLQTSVLVRQGDTEYVYGYVRQK
jgi:hypothetical protein